MLAENVKLSKCGDTQWIKNDDEILNEMNLENDNDLEFEVKVKNNQIILRPQKKLPRNLEEVFQDYEGEPLGEDDKYDWGEPEGREVL